MTRAEVALVDGQPHHEPWLFDRGLHYGDGLFETMLVRNGRIRFAAHHSERLHRGCLRLQIAFDVDAAFAEARELADGVASAVIKLLATRGAATARGYAPAGDELPRRVLLRYDAGPPSHADSIASPTAVTLQSTLGENRQLAGLKHLNRLEQILARLEMRGSPAYEGLLCSSSGLVISGTMSNMFIVAGKELLTPRVDRCGIAGVMRAVVQREAALAGIPVREVDLSRAALDSVEELFMTNVRIGVLPMEALDGRRLRIGGVTQFLRQRIAGLDT